MNPIGSCFFFSSSSSLTDICCCCCFNAENMEALINDRKSNFKLFFILKIAQGHLKKEYSPQNVRFVQSLIAALIIDHSYNWHIHIVDGVTSN